MGTRQKELLDIDGSSVILEDGITKLNTIGHYEVRTTLGPHVPTLIAKPDWMRSSLVPCKFFLKITGLPATFWNSLGQFSSVAHLVEPVDYCSRGIRLPPGSPLLSFDFQ